MRWLIFKLIAVCAGLAACTGSAEKPAGPVPRYAEAEEILCPASGGSRRSSICAAGGQVARGDAGSLAYDFRWNPDPAELWVRYSGQKAAELKVRWAAEEMTVALPATGQSERFEWSHRRLPVLPGSTRVTLRWQDAGRLSVDCVAILPVGESPAFPQVPWLLRDGNEELRCSTHGRVFDPGWVLQILRTQRQYFRELVQVPFEAPLGLVAVAREDWPDPQTSSFQNRELIFLPDQELHLAWRNYPHEMFHVLQYYEFGDVPRFVAEGTAFVATMWSELDLFDRRDMVQLRVAGFDELLSAGNDLYRRGGATPVNPVFLWGAEEFQGGSIRLSYEWSYALFWQLSEEYGRSFLADFARLLRQAGGSERDRILASGPPLGRARAVVRLLSAMFDRDLTGLFERYGLPRSSSGEGGEEGVLKHSVSSAPRNTHAIKEGR